MSDKNSIAVLQIFSIYLPNTQNWAYRLLENADGIVPHIAAERFAKHNFYNPEFIYINNPFGGLNEEVSKIAWKSPLFWKKALTFIMIKLMGGKFFPLKRHVKKHKIHLAHSHFATIGSTYSNWLKKEGIPHIVSFYGVDYEFFPHVYPKYKAIYQQLFKDATVFLCEGTHGAKILEKSGCPKDKIRVQPLGVEIDKIEFIPRKKESQQLKLVQIAAYREKKGHIYTIRAFHQALKTSPNMHLTLIGSGDRTIADQLQTYIDQNDLKGNVSLLASIDFSKLYEVLGQFDVFIHPSCYTAQKDCEGGAPVVLLDAQATGMPVISTTHCDIPDEVIHGETGLLSPEKDVAGIAKSIEKFYYFNDAEYQAYSKRARKHVAKNYDILKNAKTLASHYRAALNQRNRT